MQGLFIPKGRAENEGNGHWRDLGFKILKVTKLQPPHKTLVPLTPVPNLLPPSAGLRSTCSVPVGEDGIWRPEVTTEPNLNEIHLWAIPTHTHLSLLLLTASLNSRWCYTKRCASCTLFIFHVGLYLI